VIKPIKKRFESKIRGEVAENGDGENNDRKTEPGIRKVQQLIEPLKRLVNKVCRSRERDNEQRSTEKIPKKSSEEAVVHKCKSTKTPAGKMNFTDEKDKKLV
jgi:hypothetical protein